jgi:HEAT repeat protein
VAAVISATMIVGCPADPGYGGRTSADWIRQLSDPGDAQRQRAALALGEVLELQPNSPRVVAALVRALRDTVDGVRETAGVALNAPGVRVDAAMPVLVELLVDSAHSHTREHGAMIIGAFGSRAAPAVPALVRALDDPIPEVRAAAAEAIGRVGPTAADAAAALGRHISDPSPAVRLKVVEATLNVRAPGDVALTVLTTALRDEVPPVRAAAGYAVGGMILSNGRPDTARVDAFLAAVPDLLVALTDAEPSVRAAAAFALGQFGSRAPVSVLPALRRTAGDPDPVVRAAAEAAIATLEGRSLPQSADAHADPIQR